MLCRGSQASSEGMCKKKKPWPCEWPGGNRKTTGAGTHTASRRYRRSLVSKGRFTTSINVICVGIRSGPPKRRYRVVIDYVM
jgi:hypothetical protein